MGILNKKMKYYSLVGIKKIPAQYRVIIGERSNGKTFACLEEILSMYTTTGKQGGYIRRWAEDLKTRRAQTLWNGLISEKKIEKYTNGKWTGVEWRNGKWHLSKFDIELDKTVIDETPICYAFTLATMEHDKSTSYPDIDIIVFDEFLTRGSYLPEEFILFMNVVSTIIRHRLNVQIYMLGNTVNKSAPYFKEMGLTNVDKMKQGDIDIYKYGESGLQVAVEYCNSPNKEGKPSDLYFAFNNPKLQMITGGAWEMSIYPHCPCKYKYKDIRFTYFIIWESDILQCEIVQTEEYNFTFIHRKSTPLKEETEDLIYCPEQNVNMNWTKKITSARNLREERVQWYFKAEKIFYQDNEVGEVVRNYLNWCKQN
jgi:hypothetical protein